MMKELAIQPAISKTRAWSAVLALSLTAFALVASEFMPVSLLTPIANDLQVSEGLAGQAISVAAAFALLTSLFLSSLAGAIDRRWILLSFCVLMVFSCAVVALAPNYPVLLVGRVLIGVAIGGFWSMSAATAMRLVTADEVPRALAIVNGGNALATVVAAPIGSFLGAIIGWRGAFLCVVPVALIALAWLFKSLPRMTGSSSSGTTSPLGLMKQPSIAIGMLAVSVFFMGQFSLFTYLRPFLETVTHAEGNTLSIMLFVIGVAGFAGTFLIGAFLKDGLYRTLVIIPVVMAAVVAGLAFLGKSIALTTVLLGIWGLVATAAPVGWWTWIARALPQDAEAGGGLMVAIIQLAIGLGAVVGGMLYDLSGYKATFTMSALLLLIGAALAWGAARAASSALTSQD